MADVSVLRVHLHGRPIATLTRVAGDRTLFAFDEAYVAAPARPTLSLGFKDAFGELITEHKPTQTRLLPFFSGLLPEGHLRTYLAERAGVKPAREFFLLRALGRDLPGAVTVIGEDDGPPDGGGWDGGTGQDHRAQALRFSLAGVQLKFSAVHEARGGLTVPARGEGGDWIVKLPSREFAGVPENEFAMMSLARAVGITVPAIRLVDLDRIENLPRGIGPMMKGQAFAIERFDRRPDGSRVHVEDFAQVFGVYPDEKYGRASYRNILAVLAAEGTASDVAEFIRRLVFAMLIGNADMHLKNWSLIYPDRRRAALAPAYDLVSTVAYIPDEHAALTVSRSKRFDQFDDDELTHLASKAQVPARPVITVARETVALFRERWAAERPHLPLDRSVMDAVERQLAKIPLARR